MNTLQCLAALAALNLLTAAAADYTNSASLFSFGGTNGAIPASDLIEGSDGKLYGTTVAGGTANVSSPLGLGTVFSINKDGTGFKVLHFFAEDGLHGQNPSGALVEGRRGQLFGTTSNGGASGKGTAFRLSLDGSAYSVIRSFEGGADGAHPRAGLTRVRKDNARTRSGGITRQPLAPPLESEDAVLYGTTSSEGPGLTSWGTESGTAFKFNEDGSGYAVLPPLAGLGSAFAPSGPLLAGSDGLLYGLSSIGFGPSACWSSEGAVFRLGKDGSGFLSMTAPFASGVIICPGTYQAGNYGGPLTAPSGNLLQASDGMLYGTASQGFRGQGVGGIFSIAAASGAS